MCKYCDDLMLNWDWECNLSKAFEDFSARWSTIRMCRYGMSPEEIKEKQIKLPNVYTKDEINKHVSSPLYGKIVLEFSGEDTGYVPIDYCPFCGKKLI